MSDTKAPRGPVPGEPTSELPDSWDGNSWLDRTQARGARLPPGRHNAITRTLNNYSSYKSWADKVRTSWHPTDKDPK
jgi:hypothetical protein